AVEREVGGAVPAEGQAGGVAAGDVAVEPAAVQLVLLLVVLVYEVAGAAAGHSGTGRDTVGRPVGVGRCGRVAGGGGRRDVVVDGERRGREGAEHRRPVGQRRGAHRCERRRRQVHVGLG